MYSVKDKYTGKNLSDDDILIEVNRDRSDEWTDYTIEDLKLATKDVLGWIDETYYEVVL